MLVLHCVWHFTVIVSDTSQSRLSWWCWGQYSSEGFHQDKLCVQYSQSSTSFKMTGENILFLSCIVFICQQLTSIYSTHKLTTKCTTKKAPLVTNSMSCIWKIMTLSFQLTQCLQRCLWFGVLVFLLVNRGRFAFISILVFHDLSCLDSMFRVPFFNPGMNRVAHESWEDVWEDLICPCVSTKRNCILSGPQKELLTLH